MRETAAVWRCELAGCGHRWLASSDVAPAKCAKCGKRGWHRTPSTAELVRDKSVELEARMEAVCLRLMSAWVHPAASAQHPFTEHSQPDARAVVVDEYSEGYQRPEPPRPIGTPNVPPVAPTYRTTAAETLPQPRTSAERLAAINASLARTSHPVTVTNAASLPHDD